MVRIFVGLLALIMSVPALAGGYGPSAARKQVEASMLLTGTIMVDPQGGVSEHAIDQSEKVEKNVLDFVNENIAQWRFEPTLANGKPVSVRNRMSVRLVAKKMEDGKTRAYINGVDFQPFRVEAGTQVASRENSMTPPSYPMNAARAGVQGTVYLVLRVDRDGKVAEMATEQVNLKVVASAADMQHWRNVLADSAAKAAKAWTFAPPSKGEQADRPFWAVRVPVDYTLVGGPQDGNGIGYGEWDVYVPGPRETIPWQDWNDAPSYSPDAMVANGGAYPIGGADGLRLLTPLPGS